MALISTTDLGNALDLQSIRGNAGSMKALVDELQAEAIAHTHLGTGNEPPVIPIAGLASEILRKQSTTLTSTQILALNTTAISIVPAGGADTIIVVDKIVAVLDYGTIAYTGGNALEFRYTNSSGVKVATDLAAASFLNLTADAFATSGGVEAQAIAAANAAVVVWVPTANPAAGNSTLDLHVYYRIVSVAT
jgi:hypothetical protein